MYPFILILILILILIYETSLVCHLLDRYTKISLVKFFSKLLRDGAALGSLKASAVMLDFTPNEFLGIFSTIS